MNAWKLHLSMAGTLAIIFGLSTLIFTVILTLSGVGLNLWIIGIIVVGINIAQWLLAPYLVDAIYKVKAIPENEHQQIHQMIEKLSQKSNIKKPKLMLSQIQLPNAFAYGSPLSGNRVAVTQGLLNNLDDGEVEAVLGHELGHLKHRDVQVMMAVSFLPALFYYIGYSLLLSGMFGGGRKNDESGYGALAGIGFMVFSWVLTILTLYLSRLREYYADRHSAFIIEGGAQKLSTGLARIIHTSRNINDQRNQQTNNSAFKSLFISDPDRAAADSMALCNMQTQSGNNLVDELLSKEPTFADKLLETFSTHPNITKRLRALKELNQNQ